MLKNLMLTELVYYQGHLVEPENVDPLECWMESHLV